MCKEVLEVVVGSGRQPPVFSSDEGGSHTDQGNSPALEPEAPLRQVLADQVHACKRDTPLQQRIAQTLVTL